MKALLVLPFLMFSEPVDAQTYSDAECKELGRLAENVMKLRQDDASLSMVLDKVVEAVSDDRAKPIVRAVILMAYDRPAFSTPKVKAEAVAEFRNDIELKCYTARLPTP